VRSILLSKLFAWRKNTPLYDAVLAVVFLALCTSVYVFLQKQKTQDAPVEEYAQVPDFTLPDASGSMVSLHDSHGKVTIVNFWASWSPYSKDELTSFVRLKKEFGDDVVIIALNRDNNPADGVLFLGSLQLGDDLLFVYDKNDEYFKKIQGFAVPETLFLIGNEDIFYQKHGPITYDEMREQVVAILAR